MDGLDDVFYKGICTPVDDIVYCEVKAHKSDYEWIDAVAVNGESHESENEKGYADFTDWKMMINDGTNSINLSAGTKYYPFRKLWRVWIDLNRDGEFEDHEMVFSEVSRSDIEGTFKIEQESGVEQTRMRVMMGLFQFRDPCHNIQYGEVEDYTVTFSGESGLLADATVESRTVENSELENLMAFPNPSSDIVSFYGVNKSIKGSFAIFNTLGQVIRSGEVVQIPNILYVSQWNSGAYTIIINYDSGDVKSSRFIVKK